MTSRSIYLLLFALSWAGFAVADTISESAARVHATHAALESARTDFKVETDAGRLSAPEQADYRRYITGLTERLRDDCRDYQLAGGDPTALDGHCDIGAPATPRAAAIDTGAERTQSERMGDADAELRAAMGEFDQTLLREQERLRNKAGGGGGGAQGGGAGGGQQGHGEAQAQTQAQTQARAGERDGEHQGREGAREATQTAQEASENDTTSTHPRPGKDGSQHKQQGHGASDGSTKGQGGTNGGSGDIPNGGDDDVIARQLREAAENETDPELRAKLWKEYRRYKDEQN